MNFLITVLEIALDVVFAWGFLWLIALWEPKNALVRLAQNAFRNGVLVAFALVILLDIPNTPEMMGRIPTWIGWVVLGHYPMMIFHWWRTRSSEEEEDK